MNCPPTNLLLLELARGPLPEVTLTEAKLAEIADLARRLAVNGGTLVPWNELPENMRRAMRAGVVRMIQALALLKYIELPE